MFDFLKKKVLVGNVPACVRLNKTLIIFHYLLYTKGKTRTYSVVFTRNEKLARAYISVNATINNIDFIYKAHKKWRGIVEPWLKGGELHLVYCTDETGESIACRLFKKSEICGLYNDKL
jgi:hypothetical protein